MNEKETWGKRRERMIESLKRKKNKKNQFKYFKALIKNVT